MESFFFTLIILSCFAFIDATRVVCFLGAYGDRRDEYATDNDGEKLCTHVIYSYGYLEEGTYKLNYLPELKNIEGNMTIFENLFADDANAPLIKMISVGNWPGEIEKKFLGLKTNNENINTFATSAVEFLKKYNFSGLHLQWIQKANDVKLIEALKMAFQPHGYLLSALGSALKNDIAAMNVPLLNASLDFLVVWAMDFYTPRQREGQQLADHHAPLYLRKWDNTSADMCASCAVNNWIKKGLTPKKIVMSIPLYGHAWTLPSSSVQLKRQAIDPPAEAAGPFHYGFFGGIVPYYEICDPKHDTKIFKDENQRMGPYAVWKTGWSTLWVGFDDSVMAVVKCKYILSSGLGGAAVWELTMDDTSGHCGAGHNPILKAISKTLASSSASPTVNSQSVWKLNVIFLGFLLLVNLKTLY